MKTTWEPTNLVMAFVHHVNQRVDTGGDVGK